MKYQLVDKETNEIITPHWVGLAPNGQLYSGGMNVTCHYHIRWFTGKLDWNGKEVYEGDIVQRFNDTPFRMNDGSLKYGTWIVEFKYSYWRFVDAPSSPSYSWPSFDSNASDMVVIGNIYKNPELLQE